MVGKILYHGSNMKVDKPMLLKGQRALDFGAGFLSHVIIRTGNEVG